MLLHHMCACVRMAQRQSSKQLCVGASESTFGPLDPPTLACRERHAVQSRPLQSLVHPWTPPPPLIVPGGMGGDTQLNTDVPEQEQVQQGVCPFAKCVFQFPLGFCSSLLLPQERLEELWMCLISLPIPLETAENGRRKHSNEKMKEK